MPETIFLPLARQLLRAGIAPRHVRRLCSELQGHYDLLVQEEVARGTDASAARALARQRLGSDADIVRTAREQPGLRSWGMRAPILTGVLVPALAFAACVPVVVVLFVALVSLANRLTGSSAGLSRLTTVFGVGAAAAMPWFVLYGLPLAWAGWLAYYTASRHLRWRWSAVGLALTAALGAVTNFEVSWPRPGVHGQLSGGVGFSTEATKLGHFGGRWLLTCLLGVALYLLFVRLTRVRTPTAL
jgi:hypothetical protein